MDRHMAVVNSSFSNQAKTFENPNMNFSKKEYLEYTMKSIGAKPMDSVLETASGTCVCARTLAPAVARVTCLDATQAMLDVGIQNAKEENITNIDFINGFIEDIPFPEAAFDIVMTRLSFHHFPEMDKPFSEMDRVLKPGGKLVIIDMEAAEETLRYTEDMIERRRDPSHVRNRSRQEFVSLYEKAGYSLMKEESTRIPVRLSAWMELTNTPENVREDIVRLMEDDIAGGSPTGFKPYKKDDEIWFEQRWLLLIGIKP